MWLYILFFILVAILVLPDMRSGELSRFKLGIFFFLFLLLWVFAGFRDGVGPDWNTYESIFREDLTLGQILSGQGTALTRVEPFFLLFCYLVKLPGGNIYAFYILFNFLSIALVFLAIRKYGVYALAGILIYMAHGYLMNFSQIRQGLAAAIFLFALHFVIHRRYLLYTGLILVAMLFHYSVLITVPFIFFSRKKIHPYWILAMLLAAILIRQLHMLPRLIMLMADITGNPVFERYVTGYLENSKFSYSIGITPLMIEWACWLIIFIIYRKKLDERFPHFNVFFNLCWMGLGVYIIATDIAVLSRLAIYFRMTFIVLLPMLLSLLQTPELRGYRVALFCLLIGISFARWYTPIKEVADNESIPNNYVPYKTILLKDTSTGAEAGPNYMLNYTVL